jgi:hypothetical protein
MKRILVTSLLLLFIAKVNYAQVAMDKAQANFIYNFTKFFDWPQAEKTGDFIIGVVGSKAVAGELEKVTAGKKNVTQNIVIKHFKSSDEITKCHVIYVGSFKSTALIDIHKKTGLHCLIISNSLSAIEKGAIIQFITEDDRLKYAFSKQNALNHGLKFHSKISEMASKNY